MFEQYGSVKSSAPPQERFVDEEVDDREEDEEEDDDTEATDHKTIEM